MSAKFASVSKRPIVPGRMIYRSSIIKIWKKFFQVDRVHLEFIHSNASCYIHTHYAFAIAFIVYSIQVFSSHDDKV